MRVRDLARLDHAIMRFKNVVHVSVNKVVYKSKLMEPGQMWVLRRQQMIFALMNGLVRKFPTVVSFCRVHVEGRFLQQKVAYFWTR